jgi:hypothetical protein
LIIPTRTNRILIERKLSAEVSRNGMAMMLGFTAFVQESQDFARESKWEE